MMTWNFCRFFFFNLIFFSHKFLFCSWWQVWDQIFISTNAPHFFMSELHYRPSIVDPYLDMGLSLNLSRKAEAAMSYYNFKHANASNYTKDEMFLKWEHQLIWQKILLSHEHKHLKKYIIVFVSIIKLNSSVLNKALSYLSNYGIRSFLILLIFFKILFYPNRIILVVVCLFLFF